MKETVTSERNKEEKEHNLSTEVNSTGEKQTENKETNDQNLEDYITEFTTLFNTEKETETIAKSTSETEEETVSDYSTYLVNKKTEEFNNAEKNTTSIIIIKSKYTKISEETKLYYENNDKPTEQYEGVSNYTSQLKFSNKERETNKLKMETTTEMYPSNINKIAISETTEFINTTKQIKPSNEIEENKTTTQILLSYNEENEKIKLPT